MGLAASQWINMLQNHMSGTVILDSDINRETANLEESSNSLKSIFEGINAGVANLAALDADMAELEKENPLEKMYGNIKEFVVDNQGMCGMGMGMGELKLNENIKLTGKELVAIDTVIKGNNNGKSNISDLVEQLQAMGIDNASASKDGREIDIKHENGTSVKIKDANGDGMISNLDYDFSDALAKFNQDLTEFCAKVQELEDKMAEVNGELEELEVEQENTEKEIMYIEDTLDNLEAARESAKKDLKNGIITQGGFDNRVAYYLKLYSSKREATPEEIEEAKKAEADKKAEEERLQQEEEAKKAA